MEFVYLMFDPASRLTKIGKSTNVHKRLYSSKTSNPLIELIYFTDKLTEKELHLTYKHKRVYLEWFDLDRMDIINITKNKNLVPKILDFKSNRDEFEIDKIKNRYRDASKYKYVSEYKLNKNYKMTKCGKFINTKTNRVLIKVLIGYTSGYWISRKFISDSQIQANMNTL